MKALLTKIGALALAAILATGVLAGCGGAKEPAATTNAYENYADSGEVSVHTGQTAVFLSESVKTTPIVTGSRVKDGSPVLSAARKLADHIQLYTGVQLPSEGDYLNAENDPDSLVEILIGVTNRKESEQVAKTLRVNDYAIEVVGNKLVVIGGCEEKTAEAVNKLIELYFSAERTELILEVGYRYQFRFAYPITSMTVDSVSVRDYTIVYDTQHEGAAIYLQKAIRDALGFEIPTATASTAPVEKEILIGDCGRSFSVKADAGSYRVGMDGKRLVFAGDDSTVILGVQAFVKQHITPADGTCKIEKSLSLSGQPSYTGSLKLMDLNVTLSGYGENAVINRYPRLYQQVKEQAPDILCLQEVSCTTWLSCIKEGYGDTPALTETYGFVGTGRNGPAPNRYQAHLEGAYNAILYNQSKYKLVDSGTFWLSETPNVASVGWDGRSYAICTWAKLAEISSGREFVVMNTQLDTYGTNAPAKGAELICNQAAEFGLPVILAGDFAVAKNTKPYRAVTGSSFADVLDLAETVGNTGATDNDYGENKSTKATAHVFVSRGLCSAKSYTLLTDLVDGKYVSAHWAIVTEILY